MSGCVLTPFAFQSTRAAEMNRLAVKENFYHPYSCALHLVFVSLKVSVLRCIRYNILQLCFISSFAVTNGSRDF
jgi:hypothetical protein